MTVTKISVLEKLVKHFDCQTIKDYSSTDQVCRG